MTTKKVSQKNTIETPVKDSRSTEIQTDHIGIDQISLNPNNPRKTFVENELLELAVSIKGMGLISPITIRPVGTIPGLNAYEIVSGEKRFRAYSILAKEDPKRYSKIPCIIKELSDKDAFDISITENLLRSDVNPFEEADAFHQMVDRFKYKIDDIALRFGKSNVFVYQRMKLSSLCTEGRNYFDRNILSLSHCMELIKINEADQKKALSAIIEEGDFGDEVVRYTTFSAKALRNWIETEIQVKLDNAIFDLKDEKLDKKAGACVNCVSRSGHNTLLFNDIEATDICFNATCFQNKTYLHIEKEIAKEEKKGKRVLKITSMYWYKDKSGVIINANDYELMPEGHKCTEKESCLAIGIIVHGEGIGTKQLISTKNDCACHKHLHNHSIVRSLLGSKPNEKKEVEVFTEEKKALIVAYTKQSVQINKTNKSIDRSIAAEINFDISNPQFLDIMIFVLLDQLNQNSEYSTITEIVKKTLTPKQYALYNDIDDMGDTYHSIKTIIDSLNESKSNLNKCDFIIKLITIQAKNDCLTRSYINEVLDDKAMDVPALLVDLFGIDTISLKENFEERILKLDKFNIQDEGMYQTALDIVLENIENYDLEELDALRVFHNLPEEINIESIEEDTDEATSALLQIFSQLFNHLTK